MNETPERICEALAWLYGGEFDAPEPWEGHDHFLIFCGGNGARDIYQRTSDGEFFEGNYACMFGVSRDVRHALAVTAPWEWAGLSFERRLDDEEKTLLVAACVTVHKLGERTFWKWRIASDDGPNMDMHADTEDAAKSAARAAYLTWMRGRFAMKGGVA
jgi:hypothetical protein